MRKRIYMNMCALSCAILMVISVFVLVLFHNVNHIMMEKQMKSEVEDIAIALEHMNSKEVQRYLESISKENDSRITVVAKDGTVLYDSKEKASQMGNHKDRPEIKEAFTHGSSFDVRHSKTLNEQTYYASQCVKSGEAVRIAYVSQSLLSLVISLTPYYFVVFAFIMVLSLVVAWKMSNTIIEPINNIDIHNPETNFRYKEFNPLLRRISKYNDERKKNEKLRREFSANVSHELKTPITTISGYADLLRNGMVKAEDVEHFSEKIYKESERLINLVNDIIKLSRLDEKKVGIDVVSVKMNELAMRVEQSLQPVTDRYKVKFDLDIENIRITAVELMMEELLYNLCENAIKYNKPGGFVHLRIKRKQEKVVIEVEDNGIGIPKDCQNRIFERFYRVDKSHSKQIGGTGLGLAIVKHVVEYHEGKIDIDSDVGIGTKIMVTLPAETKVS
ncbi:sensor histidine kinase [[Clostridium] polysaccharolyticum]|uniref:histidine kinase n=1 Tax=[Clostridium] polysaccharolyticum TaxID=29364 RepID=A0A1I0D073_9FIRM|nr:ATP-binding protein [[Clostridium] polysaccharolyticum]SET24988.1 two-component system, OmpR family, phosphate regulon sensor histidine kinase PhoR [[Clostridium] polysaccharolyticum]